MPTPNEILDFAVETCDSGSYDGLCLSCGSVQDSVEPDARRYRCESCGKRKVYGAEELLFMFS